MTALVFSDYLNQIIYAFLGIVICVVNGLLVCSIMIERSLRIRKEMLIIAGLGTADILFGLSALLMGAYRLVVMSFDLQSVASTPWECMSQSPMLLTYTANQLTVLMNIIVSIDRYIAVSHPLKYRAMRTEYAKRILFGVFTYGVIFSAVLLLTVSSLFCANPTALTRLCTASGIPSWLSRYYSTTVPFGGCLAVVIYVGVFIAGRRSILQVSSVSDHQQRVEEMQKRLTITLGIITFSTFLLYVCPNLIQFFCSWLSIPNTYSTVWANFTRVSAIVNVTIYVFRQKEIRASMWQLFPCHSNRIAVRSIGWATHNGHTNTNKP